MNPKLITMAKKINGITLYTMPECNLNCIYCYAQGLRKENNCLTLTQWQEVILQAKGLGAGWIIFAGPGEPLLDNKTLELIKYANTLGMQSILLTNGTLITEGVAENLFLNNTNIIVKLPSFNPEIYNFLSGNKNPIEWVPYEFVYKQKKIKHYIPFYLDILLKKYSKFSKGRKRSLRIETVITAYNLKCIIEIAKFIRAHRLEFLFETLIFNNSVNFDKLIPGKEDYWYLYRELKKYLGFRFILSQNWHKCPVRNNPVILQNGDMLLCLVQRAGIGNIRQNSLRELWEKRLSVKEERLRYKRFFGFTNCLGRQVCNREESRQGYSIN